MLASITSPGIETSEDCLTLNVWTKPQTGEKKKAVMVYVHGGTFVSGMGSRFCRETGFHYANTVLTSLRVKEAPLSLNTTGSSSPTKRTSCW